MDVAIFLALLIYLLLCFVRDIRYLISGRKQQAKLISDLDEATNHLADLKTRLTVSEKEVSRLKPFTAIADLAAEGKRIKLLLDKNKKEAEAVVSHAELEYKEILTTATNDAAKLIQEANKEASRIISDARKSFSDRKQKSEALMTKAELDAEILRRNAKEHADEIIADAELKALEIAGDAYKAKGRAEEYEKLSRAIRNIIQGYGDEYLKPTFSLLDDLAEEMQHTEAAKKLKDARSRSATMVKHGLAANCDYAENSRRTTAIKFVIDAFNGKVDSILSLAKKDNYGKLEQEIHDAFSIVNEHGKAFRNARIEQAYLSARISELHWAVITHQLKEKEREEQRLIKEQIREEEKARRDFLKAQQEAEKEELLIKKTMEKVQADLLKANDQQRAEYEAKLAELNEKLVAAEEKNQRALSMAQQTKTGHVYIISNIGSFGENVYKIGMTRRLEPLDRVKELGDASVPFEFDVHAMILSDNAPALERDLHKRFLREQVNKVNPRKEFFRVGLAEIKSYLESRGVESKWTMISEAAQYRETLAIEKQIAENPELMQEWLTDQIEEVEEKDAALIEIED